MASSATPGPRERPLLGRLLSGAGRLSESAVAAALKAQRSGAPYRLGDLLTARGLSDEASVAEGLARQRGLGFVDLTAFPPDPALLSSCDAPAYLAGGVLPWRRIGRVTTYAVVDPETGPRALARLHRAPGLFCVAVTTRAGLEQAVADRLGEALAARASSRTPAGQSVRGIGELRRRALAVLLAIAALMVLGGAPAVAAGLVVLFLINAATMGLRVAALVAGRAGTAALPGTPPGTVSLAVARPLPKISILVPLYREANMVRDIAAALGELDYPRERLDVRLLLEADDTATRRAVAEAALPGWVRPLVVPRGLPRTKPRALNYALDFCEGEIVGILDAEDRPAPDQLRAVAASLAAAPPDVACVQCPLAFYNPRENWLSRCFQIEYAIWFEVLLRGFQALGLPIPLGGTSVYFRRSVLDRVGAWDAHNVTEDADLGMRLARMGYRCAVIGSVTTEEANCRAASWIRQRSRWLKGYILTWLSHMRAPRRLWRDLGPRGFFALNLLFVGAATAYLAMPLFWVAVVVWALEGTPLWRVALPGWVIWPAMISLALGQAVMLACASLAMLRRGATDLLWWVPTLPFYWTLGAVAAWKAVLELFVAPFWWDKTEHGLTREGRRARVRRIPKAPPMAAE